MSLQFLLISAARLSDQSQRL